MAAFCMKLTSLKPNTGSYQELRLTPHTENSGDIYRHPVVERACGKEMDYGKLFAYLFRRFGYPNIGWDGYKELASYYLSTPLRDMILEVTPYTGDSTHIHFRFFVSRATHEKLQSYESRDFDAHRARMLSWIEANDLLPPWMDEFVAACNTGISPAKDWRQAFPHLCWFTFEDEGSEQKVLGDWYKEVTSRYEAIEPAPLRVVTRSLNWEEWSDEDPLKAYYKAAYATLLDLARPVYVRDIYINAYGRIPDKELRKYRKGDSYANSAGYPSGAIGNAAPEAFSDLHSLIHKIGKGNLEKGLKLVLEHCESLK